MAHTLIDTQRPAGPGSAVGGPDGIEVARRRRLGHACEVLEGARRVIERGWLQGGWYLAGRPRPRSLVARLRQPEPSPTPDELHRACLVAAVAVVAHGGGRPDVGGDAGPALDLVWDALWETRGQLGLPAAGRSAPPEVRAARMRELVRWNDARGRTRQDVLALLDRAISRGILSAVGSPAAHPRPAGVAR